jgi:polyvinyl alcohol dehydrogenase (cytochrome)
MTPRPFDSSPPAIGSPSTAPRGGEPRAIARSCASLLSVWILMAALGAIVAAPSGAAAAGDWVSYGHDLANSRSQPRSMGIGAATAPRLVERWARRHTEPVDGTTYSVTGNPAVAGGTAYYTNGTGRLVAVHLRTGRLRWATKVSATASSGWAAVTSSPAVAGGTVYVSALEGRVVAVSARTGAIRWSKVLDTHGHTALFSSPVVSGRRVVVGVASAQNFFALPPYDFRGSVAALDTRTGKILWQTYTMPGDLDGRGGSVWGTAAIDKKRGIAYIGTGQGYSRPVGELTDALLALRLKDGSLAWHRQFTPDDVWNVFGGELAGKDWDIGASPNLFRIGRRDVVGVGDKGGRYATLDRKTGATVWRRQLCAGSHIGGIMTTAAVAHGSIWVTCNKPSAAALGTAPTTQPTGPTAPYFDWPLHRPPSYTDIFRLSATSGRTVWRRRVPGVTFGALTEAGGAVFVPNTNGSFRALDARSGRVLWKARPGAPIGGGATVAGGAVLIGYGVQFGLNERMMNPPPGSRGGIAAYTVRRR